MNKALTRLKQLGRRVGSLRRTKIAFREISVIGPDPNRVNNLVGAFLNAETGGANILQSDDPLAVKLRKNGEQGAICFEGGSFFAHYLLSGKAGKSRLFRFHLPSTTGNDDSAEKGLWQFVTDVVVFDWPYDRMAQSTSESLDDIFHLGGNLCRARDRGRLKRAALVVSGIPDHLAPRHQAQLDLTFRPKESFQTGVNRQLKEGADMCGHPLADPSWRNFLENEVLPSPSLARLYETTRLSLGRPIPVVFLPSNPLRKTGAASLLDWVAQKRKGSGSRREKLVAMVNVAGVVTLATLALIFSQLTWVQSPLSKNLDPELPAVFDNTQVNLNYFDQELNKRITRQDAFPLNSLKGLLQIQDSAAPLVDARADIQTALGNWKTDELCGRNRQAFLDWSRIVADRISQDLERLAAKQKDGLLHSGQAGCDSLASYLNRRAFWLPFIGADGIADTTFSGINQCIEAVAWMTAISSLQFQLRNDQQGDRFQVEGNTLDNLEGHLNAIGNPDLVDQISTLLESPTYRGFLNQYCGLMHDGSETTRWILQQCISLLPEIKVDTILQDIRDSSLKYNSNNRTLQRARLADIGLARDIDPIGKMIISSQQAQEASSLLHDLNAALDSRPMTVHLSSSEPHWHFHLSTGKNGSFSTVPWAKDGEEYCVLKKSLRPFQRVYLKLCNNRKLPADVGQGMCGSGKRATEMVLRDPDQVVKVGEKDFRIEVVSGWPEWPPSN